MCINEPTAVIKNNNKQMQIKQVYVLWPNVPWILFRISSSCHTTKKIMCRNPNQDSKPTDLKDRRSVKSGGRSEWRWSWTAWSDDGAGSHLSADDSVSRSLKSGTKQKPDEQHTSIQT